MTIPEYLLSIGWQSQHCNAFWLNQDQDLWVSLDTDGTWELSSFDDEGNTGRWILEESGDTLEELRTALGNLKVKA